jgi:hypothetical protein
MNVPIYIIFSCWFGMVITFSLNWLKDGHLEVVNVAVFSGASIVAGAIMVMALIINIIEWHKSL